MGLGPAMWAFVLSALALPFVLFQTLDEHTGQEALRQARAVTVVATAVRSYYTTNVVGPVIRNKGQVTLSENYHNIDGGIPIPATLALELGNVIRERTGARDFEFRFVSDLPFRNRVRVPLDEFQIAALRSFRESPVTSTDSQLMDDLSSGRAGYWRIENTPDKKSMMRLAVPVRMEANCVACHNSHPDSPYRNWSSGDVRGLQEVAVEFDTEGQIKDSTEAITFLVWFIGIGFLALREHRSRVRSLNQVNAQMDQSRSELQASKSDLEHSIRELQTKTTVLDMAPFGILVMNPVNDGARIEYANHAFTQSLGYELSELQGRPPNFLFGDATDTDTLKEFNQTILDRQRHELELATYTREGVKRSMRWLIFPSYDRDGSLLNMVACLNDVTEMRRTELERQQLASELQESTKLQSLGLAIAGIAHDLNTPIGVAVTAATLIQKSTDRLQQMFESGSESKEQMQPLIKQLNKSADMISRNLSRASQLVRSFKQTTADASRGQWQRLTLSSLLESLTVTLSPLMRRANCKVSVICPQELKIYTEPGALTQALSNLMVNTTLHAFEGVSNREVTIKVFPLNEERIQIDVVDNGNGMSEEAAAKAFTPFFTTRRQSGGSGLGLFSSRRTVEEVLGGRISFKTHLGQGTTFSIELPISNNGLASSSGKHPSHE